MHMFTGSLRMRLIMGFLFCAVLTAISGGAGIFSLGKIKLMMEDSTGLVNENIDRQHRQIEQLMPIRTLVTQTLDAKSVKEIAPLRTRCQSLLDTIKSDPSNLRGIHSETRALIETKFGQLTTLDTLKLSLAQTTDFLDRISGLTKTSVQATQNASISSIETELAALSDKFRTKIHNNKQNLDENIDELMMTSEMSISAVRAALSVQVVTLRQQALINALFHTDDFKVLSRLEKEILALQGDINSELVELPDDETTQTLILSLNDFSNVATAMFEKKKEELTAGNALKEKQALIIQQMSDVELALMAASKQVKSNIDLTMDQSGSLIQKWQTIQVVLAVSAIVLALVIGFISAAAIITPLTKVITMLKDIAQGEGDLTKRLDDKGKDEMSQMAGWFNTFVEKIQIMVRGMADNTQVLETGAKSLLSLASDMSQGAQQTTENAETVLSAAMETSTGMETMDLQSKDASSNIQSISSAVEEMTISVDEIARNAAVSGRISKKAVDQSQQVLDQVNTLNLSSREIGKVTQVIQEISEQTHLLALNATIEAARAGEAGKGFMIVAGEIKDLSEQTAAAIEEINDKVGGIRSAARYLDQGITGISSTISKTNESMNAIVSAVEEQSATTKEISENLAHASQGIHTISDHISDASRISGNIAKDAAQVNQTAETIAKDSSQVNDNAQELTTLAQTLRTQAEQFAV